MSEIFPSSKESALIKITVTAAPIEVINYTSKKDGSPQQLRKQTAYAHVMGEDGTPGPFPDKFGFLLDRDQTPYPAGEYQLHPSAIAVDRDGRLTCYPRLTPVKQSRAA